MLDFDNIPALRQALFGHRRLCPELLSVMNEVAYLAAIKAAS